MGSTAVRGAPPVTGRPLPLPLTRPAGTRPGVPPTLARPEADGTVARPATGRSGAGPTGVGPWPPPLVRP
ncbi:hypothetical protein GCM10028775_50420 [Catellatospora paridis]